MKKILYLTVAALLVLGGGCSKKSEDTTPVDDPTTWTVEKRNEVFRLGLEATFGVPLNTVPTYTVHAQTGTPAQKNFSNEDAVFYRDTKFVAVTISGKVFHFTTSDQQVGSMRIGYVKSVNDRGTVWAVVKFQPSNLQVPFSQDVDALPLSELSFTKK